MIVPDIFDRRARLIRRDRMAQSLPSDSWVIERMADELLERWQDTCVPTKRVLIVGQDVGIIAEQMAEKGIALVRADPSFKLAQKGRGVQCEEDLLPFADGSFDVIFWVGTLDSVNDVPGALILTRRALAPGGLFLGAFLGAGSLATLRQCIVTLEDEQLVARLHPQIDVRAAGDLLSRAGFSRPVADAETLVARYSSLSRLISDLRANGQGNVLLQRAPVKRKSWAAWLQRFEKKRDLDGKVVEDFAVIHLTGYAPGGVPQEKPPTE
jgi:NADH dehydrogenase [ubiquinone] 1 alpha subcomplex assembly factor 5